MKDQTARLLIIICFVFILAESIAAFVVTNRNNDASISRYDALKVDVDYFLKRYTPPPSFMAGREPKESVVLIKDSWVKGKCFSADIKAGQICIYEYPIGDVYSMKPMLPSEYFTDDVLYMAVAYTTQFEEGYFIPMKQEGKKEDLDITNLTGDSSDCILVTTGTATTWSPIQSGEEIKICDKCQCFVSSIHSCLQLNINMDGE